MTKKFRLLDTVMQNIIIFLFRFILLIKNSFCLTHHYSTWFYLCALRLYRFNYHWALVVIFQGPWLEVVWNRVDAERLRQWSVLVILSLIVSLKCRKVQRCSYALIRLLSRHSGSLHQSDIEPISSISLSRHLQLQWDLFFSHFLLGNWLWIGLMSLVSDVVLDFWFLIEDIQFWNKQDYVYIILLSPVVSMVVFSWLS